MNIDKKMLQLFYKWLQARIEPASGGRLIAATVYQNYQAMCDCLFDFEFFDYEQFLTLMAIAGYDVQKSRGKPDQFKNCRFRVRQEKPVTTNILYNNPDAVKRTQILYKR